MDSLSLIRDTAITSGLDGAASPNNGDLCSPDIDVDYFPNGFETKGNILKRYSLLLIVVIIISLSNYNRAQNQHPNQARGFNSNGVYSSFDIDHINTFNGNLVVTIPIGQSYPVNGSLSYSLSLVYNSNAWSPREVCPQTIGGGTTGFYSPMINVVGRDQNGDRVYFSEGRGGAAGDGSEWSPLPARFSPEECRTIQDPNPAVNAGLGWHLTMGKIYQPRIDVFDERSNYTEKSEWVYMSPDGSEHTFYSKLHGDDPVGGSTNIWYTRDGTYLRLNFNPPTNDHGNMLIEFPDGTKQYFTKVPVREANAATGLPEIAEEQMSYIEDRFGNFVRVDYLDTNDDADTLRDNLWIISDSIGRRQTVTFKNEGGAGYPKSVSDVALEAFDLLPAAHYYFTYTPKTIKRPVPHVPPGLINGYTDEVNVAFLKEIKLPDGSTYSMPVADSYFIPTEPHTNPGVLQKIVLPTGGNIQWKYESETPDADLTNNIGYLFSVPSSSRHYARSSFGVRRRIVTEGGNEPRTSIWKYDPKLGANLPTGCQPRTARDSCAPVEFVNTVTTPEGDHTRYYFSVSPFPYDNWGIESLPRGLSDPHSADYGLPFTKDPRRSDADHDPLKKTYNDAGGKPLFLSQAIYDSAWNLKRSVYLRYETDAIDPGDGFGSMRDANNRVAASRTVYDDDGGKYAEVINSEFDGLGHYRRETTSGNFGAGDSRTEVTAYNKGTDDIYHVYSVDPTTNQHTLNVHNYLPFNEARAWLLNLYDYKTSSEGIQTSTTYFQFDERGVLIAKRIRKEFDSLNSLGENDVLVQYKYTANGNLESESYFGGDRENHINLGRDERFPNLVDKSPEYRINYGYQCEQSGGVFGPTGVPSSARYEGADFDSTDDTVDCRTGLVKLSRDGAKVETKYFYESMGRLTDVIRQQGSVDRIKYEKSVGGSLPKVTVSHMDRLNQNVNDPAFGQEIYIYDQLGRLITEKRLLPSGYQVRNTSYNRMGWVTSVSEWLAEGPNNKKTVYENFDPFGRANRILLPDYTPGDTGNHHAIQMGYLGVREVSRTVRIGKQINAAGIITEAESTTKETYDRQGRLAQVTEPAGASGENTIWEYLYNVNNQIKEAKLKKTSGETAQTRSFTYDNPGNLLYQALPERGWLQSSQYDTMGKPGKRHDNNHWLDYTYDKAGRPTATKELVDGVWTWRLVKEFSYYDSNNGAGGAFSLGKLKSSTRHNYVRNPYEINQNTMSSILESQPKMDSGNTGEVSPEENPFAAVQVTDVASTTPIYDISVKEEYTYFGIDGRMSKRKISTNIPGIGPTFEQSFTYDQLGNLLRQSYPQCTNNNCAQSIAAQKPWIASYGYTLARLSSVGGGAGEAVVNANRYASSLTYNSNGTIESVKHSNGITDQEKMDLNNMQRIRQIIAVKGASSVFDTGEFFYDGSGNITRIGADWYLYDKVNRLMEGTALLGTDPLKRLKQQYDYDIAGNRVMTRTYNNVSLTSAASKDIYDSNANLSTNRLNVNYDAAGNILGANGNPPVYTYDAFNQIINAPGLTYLYGPNEERFWTIDTKQNNLYSDNEETFTLRGLNNEVLREYKVVGGNEAGHWFWQKDYIYRDSKLLAAETPNGIRHYHVDHLGSPRLITDANGVAYERLQFLPFGENSGYYQNGESWSLSYSGETIPTRLRFTGHEKDSDILGLDYMHARHYWERTGRFMSLDPGNDTDPLHPQSWNLYSYVQNNPINRIDPNGHAQADSVTTFRQMYDDAPASLKQYDAGTPNYLPFGPGELFILENISGGATVEKAVLGTLKNMLQQLNPFSGLSLPGKGEVGVKSGKWWTAKELMRYGKDFTRKGIQIIINNNRKRWGTTLCERCGIPTVPAQQSKKGVTPPGNETQADHIDIKSKGGAGVPSRGQVLCRDCNIELSNKPRDP
jgi:RHS repeat-associated protein